MTTSVVTGVGDACGVLIRIVCVPSTLVRTSMTVAGSVVPSGAPRMKSTVTGAVKFRPISCTSSLPRGEPLFGITL